ncbi:Las1-domain-containing protein [Xylariaceae sp. FL0255]|nr:Las1-domain-containing protein [Xylariaceae sp. FL0255]
MVQYIHTPWRDQAELLQVRTQFYSHQSSTTSLADSPGDAPLDTERQQRQAVTRVCMWMHRGDCPHLIEATAFLTDAVLGDLEETRSKTQANFVSVRLAYAAAFSRFVTGLLDSQQDKLRKQGMYSIAKNIGLPATFVELRHRATHEPLPSLKNLRSGVHNALEWIWEFYWKDLMTLNKNDSERDPSLDQRKILLSYLQEQDEAVKSRLRAKWKSWDEKSLLLALQDVANAYDEPQLTRKALQLSREILDSSATLDPVTSIQLPRGRESIESLRAEIQMLNRELDGLETVHPAAGIVDAEKPDKKPEDIPGTGSHDNYAYLVVDDKSKDAVIVDPAHPEEVTPVLKKAIQDGRINLKAIVNTHHHWDHSGGNKKLLADLDIPSLPIIGGAKCEAVTKTPANGESWSIGDIAVKGLYTPCHTQDSICWFMQDGNNKVVFTGDTLFHGGCGRFFEGTAGEMHTALNKTLASLPDDTKVFPGHEYTKSNVKFGVSVLQSEAVKKLQSFAESNKETQGKFTIGDEKQHNVFMRVEDPEIQKVTGKTDPIEVMAKLREMKNNFKPPENKM